jgi:hypothetical protein
MIMSYYRDRESCRCLCAFFFVRHFNLACVSYVRSWETHYKPLLEKRHIKCAANVRRNPFRLENTTGDQNPY